MWDLHGLLSCFIRGCAAATRRPANYHYVMVPATAELTAKLQRKNPSALMTLEELANAPPDFLHICKQVGARFAVAELS